MEYTLDNLKPERLFHYFYEILDIPRPSKKEEKIIAYLVEFGQKHNLETLRDEVGNVLIKKAAYPGKENMPVVCLQSHIDMVCEKNSDTEHDFDNDPIIPRIDGEWLKATGTTLGADDGIGVAAQLAILEADDIKHGPIECLFTIDEETGLSGAFGLQPGFLKSSVLLNLDSEDDGELFIGCAGGIDTLIEMDYQTEACPTNSVAFDLKLTGLKGGHSGDEINKGLGNAVKLMNRFMWFMQDMGLKVAAFNGGNLRNAIPREAFATVVVPSEKVDGFKAEIAQYNDIYREELHVTEPDLKFAGEEAKLPTEVLNAVSQANLLNSLYACPHGVIAMSQDIENFVETSTNLASIKFEDQKIQITTSQRSSIESAKDNVAAIIASTFNMVGAKVVHSDGYPGWTPNPNSKVVALTSAKYKELFNQEPKVLAIHAGLECGLIGEKYPGMDMISYGPTIKGAHSPDERLLIDTVIKFWDLTIEVLENMN